MRGTPAASRPSGFACVCLAGATSASGVTPAQVAAHCDRAYGPGSFDSYGTLRMGRDRGRKPEAANVLRQ